MRRKASFFPPEGLAQSTTLIVSGNLEKISWTLNEVFHRTTRLDEYVYQQGGAGECGSIFQDIYEDIRMMLRRNST